MVVAQRGRPAGPSDSTMAKAREVTARHAVLSATMTATEAVATIAAERGVETSTVWDWLGRARGSLTVVGTDAPAPEAAPRPKPRMSQRTLVYRAVIAMRLINVFRLLGEAVALFWLAAVMEIHELGDGEPLTFGGPGDAYRTRREFAEAAGRTEAELEDLLYRGLLASTDGGGIDLPVRFGLRPRERLGGNLVMGAGMAAPGPARPSRNAPDPRQTSLPPMGMPAPRGPSDSGNIQTDDSGNNPASLEQSQPEPGENPDVDSGNIQADDSGKNAVASAEKGTTTTTEERESLLGGGGLVTAGMGEARDAPGADSGKIPGADSGNIPPDDSGKNAAPPPHVALATELAVLVGRPAQPTPVELETVRGWLSDGASPELIRDAVRTRMARKNAPPTPALGYFNDRVREFMARPASAPAAAAPVTPPSPEDAAIRARVLPSSAAWARDGGCPFPPGFLTFREAVTTGRGPLAHHWVDFWDAWDAAGRPGRARPPDFTLLATDPAAFETELLGCEEELTAPDAPDG